MTISTRLETVNTTYKRKTDTCRLPVSLVCTIFLPLQGGKRPDGCDDKIATGSRDRGKPGDNLIDKVKFLGEGGEKWLMHWFSKRLEKKWDETSIHPPSTLTKSLLSIRISGPVAPPPPPPTVRPLVHGELHNGIDDVPVVLLQCLDCRGP